MEEFQIESIDEDVPAEVYEILGQILEFSKKVCQEYKEIELK